MLRADNNNFILCMQELDSLPHKIAGKLVVSGLVKYMNSISTKTKILNYYKALQVANLNGGVARDLSQISRGRGGGKGGGAG